MVSVDYSKTGLVTSYVYKCEPRNLPALYNIIYIILLLYEIINTKLGDWLLFGNGAHAASPKDWTQEREAEIKCNLTSTVQWSLIKNTVL